MSVSATCNEGAAGMTPIDEDRVIACDGVTDDTAALRRLFESAPRTPESQPNEPAP